MAQFQTNNAFNFNGQLLVNNTSNLPSNENESESETSSSPSEPNTNPQFNDNMNSNLNNSNNIGHSMRSLPPQPPSSNNNLQLSLNTNLGQYNNTNNNVLTSNNRSASPAYSPYHSPRSATNSNQVSPLSSPQFSYSQIPHPSHYHGQAGPSAQGLDLAAASPIRKKSYNTNKESKKDRIGQKRVPIWNVREQRKISGFASPMEKNLQKYLDQHPDCVVYDSKLAKQAKNRAKAVAAAAAVHDDFNNPYKNKFVGPLTIGIPASPTMSPSVSQVTSPLGAGGQMMNDPRRFQFGTQNNTMNMFNNNMMLQNNMAGMMMNMNQLNQNFSNSNNGGNIAISNSISFNQFNSVNNMNQLNNNSNSNENEENNLNQTVYSQSAPFQFQHSFLQEPKPKFGDKINGSLFDDNELPDEIVNGSAPNPVNPLTHHSANSSWADEFANPSHNVRIKKTSTSSHSSLFSGDEVTGNFEDGRLMLSALDDKRKTSSDLLNYRKTSTELMRKTSSTSMGSTSNTPTLNNRLLGPNRPPLHRCLTCNEPAHLGPCQSNNSNSFPLASGFNINNRNPPNLSSAIPALPVPVMNMSMVNIPNLTNPNNNLMNFNNMMQQRNITTQQLQQQSQHLHQQQQQVQQQLSQLQVSNNGVGLNWTGQNNMDPNAIMNAVPAFAYGRTHSASVETRARGDSMESANVVRSRGNSTESRSRGASVVSLATITPAISNFSISSPVPANGNISRVSTPPIPFVNPVIATAINPISPTSTPDPTMNSSNQNNNAAAQAQAQSSKKAVRAAPNQIRGGKHHRRQYTGLTNFATENLNQLNDDPNSNNNDQNPNENNSFIQNQQNLDGGDSSQNNSQANNNSNNSNSNNNNNNNNNIGNFLIDENSRTAAPASSPLSFLDEFDAANSGTMNLSLNIIRDDTLREEHLNMSNSLNGSLQVPGTSIAVGTHHRVFSQSRRDSLYPQGQLGGSKPDYEKKNSLDVPTQHRSSLNLGSSNSNHNNMDSSNNNLFSDLGLGSGPGHSRTGSMNLFGSSGLGGLVQGFTSATTSPTMNPHHLRSNSGSNLQINLPRSRQSSFIMAGTGGGLLNNNNSSSSNGSNLIGSISSPSMFNRTVQQLDFVPEDVYPEMEMNM